MHEFKEAACGYCDTPALAVNLDRCLICETFQDACAECLSRHKALHSDADVEDFRREMMDEPRMTERERLNFEMKKRLRVHTENLCKMIDDHEALIKHYEKQNRILAEEVDRLRPAS